MKGRCRKKSGAGGCSSISDEEWVLSVVVVIDDADNIMMVDGDEGLFGSDTSSIVVITGSCRDVTRVI